MLASAELGKVAFVQTAGRATQGQFFENCRAVVLLRSDVIEMKRSRIMFLWKLAILTATIGAI